MNLSEIKALDTEDLNAKRRQKLCKAYTALLFSLVTVISSYMIGEPVLISLGVLFTICSLIAVFVFGKPIKQENDEDLITLYYDFLNRKQKQSLANEYMIADELTDRQIVKFFGVHQDAENQECVFFRLVDEGYIPYRV